MIRDLAGSAHVCRTADILVIGAGTVGLIMATELAKKGFSVICLESGSWRQESDTHPLNAVEHVGTPYAGAEHGRFRCLGGSSTRWGGALIPFSARDIQDAGWPLGMTELAAYVPAVERFFELPAGPYDAPSVLGSDPDHLARLAKWPSFKKRNVFSLLDRPARAEDGPEIWLNATACAFKIEEGLLRCVTARSEDGSTLAAEAKLVIIAAGAIESTRILLLIDQQNSQVISSKTEHLGRHFHDHLSAVVADLEVTDRAALNRIAGFQFADHGTMRNVRFELATDSALRAKIPPCFAHIAFEDGAQGGFSALRDMFRALQRRTVPPWSVFGRLFAGTPWLLRALWWRYVEHRLLYPATAGIHAHMVIEQRPIAANRITLSTSCRDCFDQPLARIEWDVTKDDQNTMIQAVIALENTWNRTRLGRVALFRRRAVERITEDMVFGGGIYHPGGSTRMADAADQGVVDRDLRVFSLPNVRVVSTSVLPTGGGANPTMMLLLLAFRCLEELGKSGTMPR